MLYPVFLDLQGQTVLVVGGGRVALRKVQGLLASGAHIRLVSPNLLPELHHLNLEYHPRPVLESDLTGVCLVFACTQHHHINNQVSQWAQQRNLFCNHVSQPENGNLRLGAVHRAGDTLAAFSSGEQLPFLSQALRDLYAQHLPTDLAERVLEWSHIRQSSLEQPEQLTRLRADIRAYLEGGQ